jgi:hypothetical protein
MAVGTISPLIITRKAVFILNIYQKIVREDGMAGMGFRKSKSADQKGRSKHNDQKHDVGYPPLIPRSDAGYIQQKVTGA